MRTRVSAFCLFPPGEPSNNKGLWRFICIDMSEMPPVSLTTASHCLHTATSASIRPSQCLPLTWIMKCLHRSDFPLVFGIRMYSTSRVSAMLMRRELRHFPVYFPEITEDTGTDNRIGLPYRPLLFLFVC